MGKVLGLIGGTGPQGTGLAIRFARAGKESALEVVIGSRKQEKADRLASECNDRMSEDLIAGYENPVAVEKSDYILLTIPYEYAEATVKGLADKLTADKIFVDVTVPLVMEEYGPKKRKVPRLMNIEQGSASQFLRTVVPENVPIVGAFKTISAHALGEIDQPLNRDVFVVGNNIPAKKEFMSVIDMLPDMRAVNAGDLWYARVLEGMTAMVMRMNVIHKRKDLGYVMTLPHLEAKKW
ncbi:MAG: NADPH-dependent F420 reductase [Candidatus Heimdallarchaeota archaeon]